MKCYLDANVFDWMVDDAEAARLLDLIQRRVVIAMVAADTAHEIHRIPDAKADKRARLQALLTSHFVPVAPTHVPIMGIARVGLMRLATPHVMELREQLKGAGIIGLDSNHLINASREGCSYFLTFDKDLLRRAGVIAQILGVQCVEPGSIIQRAEASSAQGAG